MKIKDLQARIVRASDLSAAEIATWDMLCLSHPDLSSPFLTPHYARAVGESGKDVRVCILYSGDWICGFLPFQFASRFAAWNRSAEPVGGQMTDYFGLVADRELSVTPEQLLRFARLSYLGFSHLDESQFNYGLQAEQPRIGLRIRLQPNDIRPLETLLTHNRKYLKDSERRERQICNEVGPVRFTFDVQDNRHESLDKLIEHKRLQYNRTDVTDPLQQGWTRDLLHILSRGRFDTCRGILSTLYAGEEWVASHFGILGNGTLQYWLPVYNPAMSKYAPGRLLIHHVINSAHAGPILMIDRGEGDTPSKRELANEEHFFFKGVWHDNSVSSSITRGVQSIKWRLHSQA